MQDGSLSSLPKGNKLPACPHESSVRSFQITSFASSSSQRKSDYTLTFRIKSLAKAGQTWPSSNGKEFGLTTRSLARMDQSWTDNGSSSPCHSSSRALMLTTLVGLSLFLFLT